MSTPQIEINEIKKVRKPRTTMKSVVSEIVRQKSLDIIPVNMETVFENDKQEEKRIKAEIEEVRDILARTRQPPMTDAVLDTLINGLDDTQVPAQGYTCEICNKTFKKNTPALIERHSGTFHHQQLLVKRTLK